jgi:hypothetical protein
MSDEEVDNSDTITSQLEGNKLEIDLLSDPWSNKRVFKLFLPAENEHLKDAIAWHIDILREARTEPDGYREIIEEGDEYSNCTKKDTIKLNDKCICLTSALTTVLNQFPKITLRECSNEASQTCSIFTTAHSGWTIEEWWAIFHEKNAFLPCGLDASLKTQSAMLPPVLHYNEDLKRKVVRFCTQMWQT